MATTARWIIAICWRDTAHQVLGVTLFGISGSDSVIAPFRICSETSLALPDAQIGNQHCSCDLPIAQYRRLYHG